MTKDEINQVLNAMDGFYVGYANVSTLKGIRTQQYVFNMTPENISGFLYTWKDRAGQILLTDMLDRPVLKMESGTIIQCKTRELEKQVYSLMCDIRSGKNAPARSPLIKTVCRSRKGRITAWEYNLSAPFAEKPEPSAGLT